MLDNCPTHCPICGRPLRNGERSKLIHDQADIDAFKAGEITPEEYDNRGYRLMTRICASKSIPEYEGNPCPNFNTVIGTIKIRDD